MPLLAAGVILVVAVLIAASVRPEKDMKTWGGKSVRGDEEGAESAVTVPLLDGAGGEDGDKRVIGAGLGECAGELAGPKAALQELIMG